MRQENFRIFLLQLRLLSESPFLQVYSTIYLPHMGLLRKSGFANVVTSVIFHSNFPYSHFYFMIVHLQSHFLTHSLGSVFKLLVKVVFVFD